MYGTVDNYQDIIDSRDVIERIAELEELLEDPEVEDHDDLTQELDVLNALRDEAQGYASDWEYGETLVRDSFFTHYAKELAEDIGAINPNAAWPLSHIDWEAAAEELKQDYTEVDFDGVTYWIRCS